MSFLSEKVIILTENYTGSCEVTNWLWIDGIIITIHTSRNAILVDYEPIMGNLRTTCRLFWKINVSFS